MRQHVAPKWRPPLALIVLGVLLAVFALPAAIVIAFRALDRTPSQFGAVEVVALLVALAITLGIAAIFSRTITGPMHALIRTTRAIARGGRAAIVAPERHGNREIAALSRSFLEMAERLVDRTEYVHSFAAHVSHELKSPLTAIRGSAELLRDGTMSEAQRQRFIENILADADRLAALLERLRMLARAEVPFDGKGASLGSLAGSLQARCPRLRVVAGGAISLPLAISEEAGLIVLGHLADNAVQHGATTLSVTATPEGQGVLIEVSDDGAGIAGEDRGRVFEPFFTTRREQGGTGMGLGIAKAVLAAHGGDIRLGGATRGASFELRLPAAG